MKRSHLRDERGVVLTVMFLCFVALFLAGVMLSAEHPRAAHGSDAVLGQTVALAVRAAAMRVDAASQANGTPRVDPAQAHATFRRMLAANLGLDASTLEPLSGSILLSPPSYVLVVYNGDSSFVAGAKAFSLIDGRYSEADLAVSGFPRSFAVARDSITYGTGPITVTLDRPGCVAVLRARIRLIFVQNGVEAVRWAAAKIVVVP
ncbi:MAG: hypothetical protein ACPLSY_04845 [Moorellaceae bacterium]